MDRFLFGASLNYLRVIALVLTDAPGQVILTMTALPEEADPAAVLAIATSLLKSCKQAESADPSLNLGAAYNGWDHFARELMRIAVMFEEWACENVAFVYLNDVWSYLLEASSGEACLAVKKADALATFDQSDCLRIAFRLRLPIWENGELPIPVDVIVANTVHGSAFNSYRIQTVREMLTDSQIIPFTAADDPFDENLGERQFSICGIGEDGLVERITERSSYRLARELVLKLAPRAICEERVAGLHPQP